MSEVRSGSLGVDLGPVWGPPPTKPTDIGRLKKTPTPTDLDRKGSPRMVGTKHQTPIFITQAPKFDDFWFRATLPIPNSKLLSWFIRTVVR